jgi:PAS domain S-box-containing protein
MPHRSQEELREEIVRLEDLLREARNSSDLTAVDQAPEKFLESALETVPVGILITDREGRIIHGNRWLEEMVRHPVLHSEDAESYGEWIAFHEDGSRVESHEYPLARVIRDGESHSELNVHYQRGDGSRFWMRIIGRPILNESGELIGASVAVVDIDTQRQLERQQALLIAELDHRVKNAFAVMNSIVRHSLRKADVDRGIEEDLNARFAAYANAHARLSVRDLEVVSLGEIVAESTGHFGEDRIEISGPDLVMPSRIALSLSMALYELGTNAFKHGALSVPGGTVRVEWSLNDRGEGKAARLTWCEAGGPRVTQPERSGFGSFIITKAVEAETDGRVSLEFKEEGLLWTLEMPMKM